MQDSRATLFSITAVLAVTVTLLFLGGGWTLKFPSKR